MVNHKTGRVQPTAQVLHVATGGANRGINRGVKGRDNRGRKEERDNRGAGRRSTPSMSSQIKFRFLILLIAVGLALFISDRAVSIHLVKGIFGNEHLYVATRLNNLAGLLKAQVSFMVYFSEKPTRSIRQC